MHILVIDDEASIRHLVKLQLELDGQTVETAADGAAALALQATQPFDLIVLDLMLPDTTGFDLIPKLRQTTPDLPILMLTARDQMNDKIIGLQLGADDYMTKPFIPEELLARIRALSRRQGEVIVEEMKFGDLTLNLSANDLCCGSKSIHLGYKEFEVLKILMSNSGRIVSKEALISRVWGSDSDAEDNNVEAYISFLRKKLHFVGSRVEISTIRKVGYRLEETT